MNQAIVRAVLICAVAISTAALYGCSSGSKNVKPPPPPPPASFDPLTDLTEAKGHDLASITLEPGKSHYGERGVGLMCPAGEKACVVKVEADGSATFDATGGEPAVSINHMILAASSGPEGDSDGNHAVGLVTRIGTTNATAGLKTTDAMVNGSIVQSTMGANTPEAMAAASWAAGAGAVVPTLKLTLGREAFGDLAGLPDDVLVETVNGDSAIPALPEGWHGKALEKSVDGGTTVYAAVYSDIEQTSTHGGPLTGFLDLSFDGGEVGVENVGKGLINLGGDISGNTPTVTFVTSLVKGGAKVQVEVDRDWKRPVPHERRGHIDVTYYSLDKQGIRMGLPKKAELVCVKGGRGGNFCKGTQIDDDTGSVYGVWQLVLPTGQQADDEYLTLGTWLSLPDSPDGRFDAGTFANGKVPTELRRLYKISGKATYTGPATGVYAKGIYGPKGTSEDGRDQAPVVESARVGSFVAEAELTADFGDDDDDPPPAGVSGSVSMFEENGKRLAKRLGGWIVELRDTGKMDDEVSMLFSGDTRGEADGRHLVGKWGVKFFNSGDETALRDFSTLTTSIFPGLPGYAAGTFSASTKDEDTPQPLNALHIIGAFGAEKTQIVPAAN